MSNKNKSTRSRADAAERTADTIAGAIRYLTEIEGVPLDVALSVAHGVVMGEITATYGGAVAAECAQRAADRVAGWPAMAEGDLSGMATKGRA